jgi:hypothetical protein
MASAASVLGDRQLLGDLASEYETLKSSGSTVDYKAWIKSRLASKLGLHQGSAAAPLSALEPTQQQAKQGAAGFAMIDRPLAPPAVHSADPAAGLHSGPDHGAISEAPRVPSSRSSPDPASAVEARLRRMQEAARDALRRDSTAYLRHAPTCASDLGIAWLQYD